MPSQFSTTSPNRASSRVALDRLAVQQRDLFAVFAHPDQVETKIGFIALLLEIEPDQRPADQMGQNRADQRIDQRAPDQITGNRDVLAEQMQRRFVGQGPQNEDERGERDDRAQQPDAERKRLLHETLGVVGDALVRVVGGVAEQLHPIVIGVMQPAAEIVARSSSCRQRICSH